MVYLLLLPFLLFAEDSFDFEGEGCVQYEGMRREAGFRYSLSFKNYCPMPVYITVCVTDRWGNKELYTSKNRVPMNGRYRRFVDEEPEAFDIAVSHLKPKELSCE